MPRFFIEKPPENGVITVTGSDAFHIGFSLRMKTGDDVTFCHNGLDYNSVIGKITESEVVCNVTETSPVKSEPNIELTLYMAMPKQDKLETVIQKTVELGVYKIVPFMSKRCVVKCDKNGFTKKLERFNKISMEAAKQSGRGIIPQVADVMTFDEMLADMKNSELQLFCYENGGERLSDVVRPNCKSIAVIIGAEGGFEREEYERAVQNEATAIGLGERILRCETCPIAVAAIIMNITGNI